MADNNEWTLEDTLRYLSILPPREAARTWAMEPPRNAQRFYRKPVPAGLNTERFAGPMDSLYGGGNPYQAKTQTADAQYAKHPDVREALLNNVSGTRTVPPAQSDMFVAIRKLLGLGDR